MILITYLIIKTKFRNMRKTYFAPAVRLIDLETEGVIAGSIKFGNADQKIDTEDAYTQKQNPDLWGNESVWK